SARYVEAPGELARQCLVVDEAIRSCRSDRPFVEPHCLGIPALDARDLGSDQRGAVLEVRRAVLGPFLQLAMVSCQSVLVLSTFRGGCRIAERSPRQRKVELVLCYLEESRRRREQWSCVRGRPDRGRVGTREEARLQLADPVPAGGDLQARLLRQVLLERVLVERGIVEGDEVRGQAAEGPDQPELGRDDV